MSLEQPIIALRSADAALIEQVRAVTSLAGVPLAIHPPAAGPPEAGLLLDSATEWGPQDPSWTEVRHRSAWVSVVPGAAAPDGGACLVLPGAAEQVLARARAATRTRRAQVVGVIGARGGVGTSALATALARACADAGLGVALADLDLSGAGVELILGIEHEGGVRWGDLAGDRGGFDSESLSVALPVWHGVHVLSADWRGGPSQGAEIPVLEALAAGHDVLVLDLARGAAESGEANWVPFCDVVLVAATCDVASAAGAQVLARALTGADVRLVVRGPAPGGLTAQEIARACELPLELTMRPERSLAAAVERGVAPGEQRRGPLIRGARTLVGALGLAD
ncbi:septum site-determining protein Ssd [Occultella kanbiaonis]|uniref:septum site-determining protein Ssd n=1 Tax=Occultella kanbiaonis TaxID=2675754 RepID=UPI0012B82C8B|nr:septum site-determining protein Ssd [Occultella kanbiaonis]